MNFSVVADDHLLGVTHVIRGKDHIANTRRQRYIYDHFASEAARIAARADRIRTAYQLPATAATVIY